jgi:hypothetical protein
MSVSILWVLHAVTELSNSPIQLVINVYYNQLSWPEVPLGTARVNRLLLKHFT